MRIVTKRTVITGRNIFCTFDSLDKITEWGGLREKTNISPNVFTFSDADTNDDTETEETAEPPKIKFLQG